MAQQIELSSDLAVSNEIWRLVPDGAPIEIER
jgi:hypothetical protein